MIKKILLLSLVVVLSSFTSTYAFQDGSISGNVSIEAQTYKQDSSIGAPKVDEQILSNAYLNLIYRTSNYEFGVRYENYLNPLLGYDSRLKGQGIAYRYGAYYSEFADVTVGNFYEQFGSGLIFRAYEERALGFDNAVDGVRLKVRPTDGVEFTGLIGKQRLFWDMGSGIVRGGNVEANLNTLLGDVLSDDIGINLGASVVSRFQDDFDPKYKLPENVLTYSTRLGIMLEDLNFDAEYAYKYNDPNATNKFNYNAGSGLILTGSYTASGIGLSVSTHWLDNMDFRSDRNARANELNINFIPPLTKQHTYALTAMYPFATKPNGEFGLQSELTFKLPANTAIGGEYGTTVNLSYSMIKSIDTVRKDQFEYESKFFGIGDRLYFQDMTLDLTRRFTDDFKLGLTLTSIIYDKDIMENEGAPVYGKVHSNVLIVDGTYNFNNENAVRVELQHQWSKNDSTIVEPDNINGNWAHMLVEYTIAPKWFFTVYDQYNYGNDTEANRLHYASASVAYLHGASRLQLSYGRQRGGIICVGGICRAVPASNGIYFSFTSSF
ncbi:MAG TPA: DUF6029 family protein [Candidatus Kapabacteria bacterium]|nr:DUF6029 family protein [Candidatus Kapabacteria bacterium]